MDFEPQAKILDVLPQSPADDAGFTAGCSITKVEGQQLRDAIDWQWYASEESVELEYIDTEGDRGTVVLERELGEDWGFIFDGAIYDKIKLCRNACVFCFMRQLPDDVRDSLVLRDDDFRLSFLQGTFVTLTNIKPEDEARIIEQHISPLRFSIHCITPELRKKVIGKHAPHGIEVAERLMAHGIEFHGQIVLMPGINDGEELAHTLSWAYTHPEIKNIGIVPLGFTKHQDRFTESFNDQKAAEAVIDCIVPFQERALKERGNPWVYAADEFYTNAYPDTILDMLPPSEHYGRFEMFEDGIGIVRSFIDDWETCPELIEEVAAELKRKNIRLHYVIGYAMLEFFIPLIERSALKGHLIPFPVKNDYFGGNVDVTGLLCGCDIARNLAEKKETNNIEQALIPKILFNADNVTLDDMNLEEIQQAAGVPVNIVSCNGSAFLQEIDELIKER